MTRWTLLVSALALAVGVMAPDANACWDNSDRVIVSLKKVSLTTEQLKDVFKYQKEHKAVVARAHKEGLGCRYHENHDAVFERKAVGVLTREQFEKHVGRKRTKVEGLEHENYTLRKEIEKLRKLIAALEKKLDAKK